MSPVNNKWLLPDGVEELLPEQAWLIEVYRRRVIDVFSLNGYDLVQPPLLEYLDSLLTGAGHDLDLLTFKVTDQHSGRMMGIRADMTPQLSRIDAHVLNQDGPTRLAYLGPVLQTAHRSGFHSREPIQFGAELYGCPQSQADIEIIRLCTDVLDDLGIKNLSVDLGHVGIFNALIEQAQLSSAQAEQLLDICQRKSWPDMDDFIQACDFDTQTRDLFKGLLSLEGAHTDVFEQARTLFKHCNARVHHQFEQFEALVNLLSEYLPRLALTVDFLELRGINYHTGAVFSVYCDGYANAIAKGGRYDDVGSAFGRAREATGFSADLRQAINFSNNKPGQNKHPVYAPFDCDPQLKKYVNRLRLEGEQVIIGFENEEYCSNARQIVHQDGHWIIKGEGE